MKHPLLLDDAKRELTLTEFARWAQSEDGIRAHVIDMSYLEAKRVGLLDALHAAREGNAEHLWAKVLEMARDVCQADGPLWEKKAQELAEAEILDLGYFPPRWTLEERELYAGELHVNNLEEQMGWECE